MNGAAAQNYQATLDAACRRRVVSPPRAMRPELIWIDYLPPKHELVFETG
jgi:hypothetical protein